MLYVNLSVFLVACLALQFATSAASAQQTNKAKDPKEQVTFFNEICKCCMFEAHFFFCYHQMKKVKSNLEKSLYKVNNLYELAKLGVQFRKYFPNRINNFKTIFLFNMLPNKWIEKGPAAIMGRSGLISQPLAGDVKDATPGKCDPKPVCISNPLTLNLNSNQLPFPQCINIHRCEGCCPTNEKCVPIKTHEVKLQKVSLCLDIFSHFEPRFSTMPFSNKVGIINIDEENNLKYNETLVSVTNHTECQCMCQWESSEDCRKINVNYIKSPYSCECLCPEEQTCDAYHEFDRDACVCKCKKDKFARMEQACKARGFVWNDTFCKYDQTARLMRRNKIFYQKFLNFFSLADAIRWSWTCRQRKSRSTTPTRWGTISMSTKTAPSFYKFIYGLFFLHEFKITYLIKIETDWIAHWKKLKKTQPVSENHFTDKHTSLTELHTTFPKLYFWGKNRKFFFWLINLLIFSNINKIIYEITSTICSLKIICIQ